MRLDPPRNVYVQSSPGRGLGVFASAMIFATDLIEECPVIAQVQTGDAVERWMNTSLREFFFNDAPDEGMVCIALGYGSMYNHSTDPNVRYVKDPDRGSIRFVATRTIEVGEELTISYGRELPDHLDEDWWQR